MYKTILVPLDGSPRAERVLPHVEGLAQLCSATVIFLQVVEWNTEFKDQHGSLPEKGFELAKQREKKVHTYLDSWKGEFREKGIVARTYVERGPVVRTIIRVAEREGADLIAMASHGHSGISRVFYGSVAAGVLQHVDRPLLLVRARQAME